MEKLTQPPLVDASAVAKRLGVSRFRIYELARTGALPHVRIGRSMRFDPQQLEQWIEEGGTGYDTSDAAS